MLKLFKPRHRSILGIDISSSSIKILEISKNDSQYTIEGYGSAPLPPNAVVGNKLENINAVANCIKTILAKNQFTSQQAVLAIPDTAVISKILQINKDLTEAEIEELVVIEADKSIPYPLDEISVDFEVLGPTRTNFNLLDVLMVASKTENVKVRAESATRAGLEPIIVEVESYAVQRSIACWARHQSGFDRHKMVAVIDIGASFTHLFVLKGMETIFTREEEFGGKQLLALIAQHYQMAFTEAAPLSLEKLKPEDYEPVLSSFTEMLLLQIKRSLQFFFSDGHSSYIDHILLAGGVAGLLNLSHLVQEETKILTTVISPIESMRVSVNLNREKLLQDAASLVTACGLALRNFG